jgi:AcrR family transcriptional regulator
LVVRTKEDRAGGGSASFAGRARQAQLVDCAIQALCEVGFAGTSISEVARRAGVSKGVVTYHFRTKDDLLQQVVSSLYERAGTRISERMDAADTTLDELLAYIEANLEFVAEHAAHVRAVMEVAANLRRPDGEPALTPADADPVTTHLQELIERGQANGEFATIDAGVLATVLRAAIDTAAARAATTAGFDASHFTRELSLIVRRTVEVRT